VVKPLNLASCGVSVLWLVLGVGEMGVWALLGKVFEIPLPHGVGDIMGTDCFGFLAFWFSCQCVRTSKMMRRPSVRYYFKLCGRDWRFRVMGKVSGR